MNEPANNKSTERVKLHRARKRGEAAPKKLHPCGTRAAAKRHVRNGDCTTSTLKKFCQACYKAESDHAAEQYLKRKAKQAQNKNNSES